MVRYHYSYDHESPRASPEPSYSRPASPSFGSPRTSTYYPSRPRPAEVEDFEGSDIEFAPRIVKPIVKPKKANKAEKADKVKPDPIRTASRASEAPLVVNTSPTSPSTSESPHGRGRSTNRDSFYSFNYTTDKANTASRATTPSNASETIRGILKTGKGKDGKTDSEKSRTRSKSRVRFPTERKSSSRAPGRSGEREESRHWNLVDSRAPGDSTNTTGAGYEYAEYSRPPSRPPSSHHTRPRSCDNRPRQYSPDYPLDYSQEYRQEHPREYPRHYNDSTHLISSGGHKRAHSRSPQPVSGEYRRQYDYDSRPTPADDHYSYYRPSPSPQPEPEPSFQPRPQYDPQYDQYDQLDQHQHDQHGQYDPYDQYKRYEQFPQYTEYPGVEFQPGPPLQPRSPTYHPVHPVPVHPASPMYIEQPRPRSSCGTYLSPQPFVDPVRPRSTSGSFLSPTACYHTGPTPYYGTRQSAFPPPSFY